MSIANPEFPDNEQDIWKNDTLPNPDLYWDIPG